MTIRNVVKHVNTKIFTFDTINVKIALSHIPKFEKKLQKLRSWKLKEVTTYILICIKSSDCIFNNTIRIYVTTDQH